MLNHSPNQTQTVNLSEGPLACHFFPLETAEPKQRQVGDQVVVIRRWECAHCGFKTMYTASIPEKIIRICDKQVRESSSTKPNLARRTLNYMKSYAAHVAAGRPESTHDQILSRLKKCVACKHYNPSEKLCSLCGCYVNDQPANVAMNKLAWADTVCPDNPPQWLPIIQTKT